MIVLRPKKRPKACEIICKSSKNEIVGAHNVVAHAGELIHEVVLAMKQRFMFIGR
jgi:pyruvate/2-oxoglutarate dehydrogenase complex dihydrolipoamide dehydrogenase (E3) component